MLLNMRRNKLFLLVLSIYLAFLITGCTNTKPTSTPVATTPILNTPGNKIETTNIQNADDKKEDEIKIILDSMTLEEKVGQMFIVVPEVFSGTTVTKSSDLDIEKMKKYNIGGLIMFGKNIVDPTQITSLNNDIKSINEKYPLFISIDEEGGQVARIGNNANFNITKFPNMSELNNSQYTPTQVGEIIGEYLTEYGFNLDFAPVCDVLLNEENTVVKLRSFGSDPLVVSNTATDILKGLQSKKILAAAKHFPGHGNTTKDTHEGFATSDATLEEMKTTELVPFAKMIDSNVDFMMISHVIYPNLSEKEVPATMNKDIIDLLKSDMGYTGVIITDGMNMGAIANNYTSAESSVEAVKAGVDVILMPEDFYSSYDAILEAVKNGDITEEQIDQSVSKILTLKLNFQS